MIEIDERIEKQSSGNQWAVTTNRSTATNNQAATTTKTTTSGANFSNTQLKKTGNLNTKKSPSEEATPRDNQGVKPVAIIAVAGRPPPIKI